MCDFQEILYYGNLRGMYNNQRSEWEIICLHKLRLEIKIMDIKPKCWSLSDQLYAVTLQNTAIL
jgi:hypothetical protein